MPIRMLIMPQSMKPLPLILLLPLLIPLLVGFVLLLLNIKLLSRSYVATASMERNYSEVTPQLLGK